MNFNREQFLDALRDLAAREVPFLHQGKDAAIGLDCISAPRYAIELQGIELPATLCEVWDNYHGRPDGVKLLREMRKHLLEIEYEQTAPGDLLVLMYRRNPQHIAVRMDKDNPPDIFEMYRNVTGVGRAMIWSLDLSRHRIAMCFRIPDFETN